ncbi:MAG: DUF1043 family protein [Gammaproteobacteria bacterium]|nr:DUF1043 family protein [Gammaproteobacteria bacterium]
MELATAVLVFLFGLCSGAALVLLKQRLGSGSQQTQEALDSCQQENAQLKQNWQDHIAEYRSLATNLHEMSEHIGRQIEDAEQLLNSDDKTPAFPFFSAEATHILKNVSRKKRDKSTLDNQPLDYSSSASGLFQGEAKKETEVSSKH